VNVTVTSILGLLIGGDSQPVERPPTWTVAAVEIDLKHVQRTTD
jgi:hypothetical protein